MKNLLICNILCGSGSSDNNCTFRGERAMSNIYNRIIGHLNKFTILTLLTHEIKLYEILEIYSHWFRLSNILLSRVTLKWMHSSFHYKFEKKYIVLSFMTLIYLYDISDTGKEMWFYKVDMLLHLGTLTYLYLSSNTAHKQNSSSRMPCCHRWTL